MMTVQQQASSLKAFSHAIDVAKGQVALSQILGCSQARISRMKAGDSMIDAEVAARIDKLLKVPKWELRPDLFDRPKGAKPYVYAKLASHDVAARHEKAAAAGKAKKKAARAKSGTARAAPASTRA